jgi:hypothetical protein
MGNSFFGIDNVTVEAALHDFTVVYHIQTYEVVNL